MTISEQKVALVTGGNRGIGLEVVHQLAQSGITVYMGSRSIQAGREARKQLDAALPIEIVKLDVTHDISVLKAVDKIFSTHGRLDILVNNAGINYDTWNSASGASMKDIKETFETNFYGCWRTIQAVLPKMKKNNWGRIVNVSSGAGAVANSGGGTPGYTTSKCALNALTRVCAAEVYSEGILVNAVCPGWVRTDMGGTSAPRTPAEGADTITWAVTLPDNGPTGCFFRDRQQIPW